MGQTLTNGIYLPAEGERNCYEGLAANWTALDGLIGGYNVHVSNTTIHVTAEDKQAWNGKADASALTAHTGDTTIHVTAEDKAKWDAVTGKANDADVVHKTGIETIKDRKTFESTPYIYNSDSSGLTPYLFFKSAKAIKGDTSGSNSDSTRIALVDKNDKVLNYIQLRKVTNGSSDITLYCSTIDGNSQEISSSLTFFKAVNGQGTLRAIADNDVNLGNSTYKWKDVNTYLFNGINPGALFMPQDRSNHVDISAYFTATSSGDTNRVTAPDDGYIFLALTDVLQAHCFSQTSNNLSHYGQTFGRNNAGQLYVMFPIRKNDIFACQWYTPATAVTVNNAYFIPCKGNV